MRRRSAITTTALVFFGIALGACDLGVPGPDESADPEATVTSSPTPAPRGSDLEDKYSTYSDMEAYVADVTDGLLYPWLDATWPSMRRPHVEFVERGDRGREGCLDYEGEQAVYTSESYEYCEPDNTVYVGHDMVWEFFKETGDAGPAMGMAHEFGHHIQYALGVDPPTTPGESIDFENQADCLAGVFTGWARDEGYLDERNNDDLEDIDALFPLIASAEDEPDRDHGTITERREAFYAGFDDGVRGCGLRAG
jgi:hypothetical protein